MCVLLNLDCCPPPASKKEDYNYIIYYFIILFIIILLDNIRSLKQTTKDKPEVHPGICQGLVTFFYYSGNPEILKVSLL